jgi:hypothetical protein
LRRTPPNKPPPTTEHYAPELPGSGSQPGQQDGTGFDDGTIEIGGEDPLGLDIDFSDFLFETGDGSGDSSGPSGPDAEIPGGEDPGDGSADPSGPDAETPGGEDPGSGELAPAASGMQMMGGMMPMGGPIPVEGGGYDTPEPIEIHEEYIISPYNGYVDVYFSFYVQEEDTGKYFVISGVPSSNASVNISLGCFCEEYGGYYDPQEYSYNKPLYYKFKTAGIYGINIWNSGNGADELVFSIVEADGPPEVTVDGTIVPSTTPGTEGGQELTISAYDDSVKIYSFEAEAGKRYGAVIYKISGHDNARLKGSFSDAYNAGVVNIWGPSPSMYGAEGLPEDIYEAQTTNTHYLNITNWSREAGTFVVKIYSDTPDMPTVSPSEVPDDTDEPIEVNMTLTGGGDIYYRLGTYGESHFVKYTSPFTLDRSAGIVAYVNKGGIFSAIVDNWYDFDAVPLPEFRPSAEEQPEGTPITIWGANDGDMIYYTTDRTDPYNSSTRKPYVQYPNITVGSDGLYIRAIIQNSKGLYGNENWTEYIRSIVAPHIPNMPGHGSNPGTVGSAFDAVLESYGASIYYTLDGSVPTSSSTLYTSPIPIRSNTRIRAIAVLEGEASEELNEFLRITEPRVIYLNDAVQGLSHYSYPEWFTFEIPSPGIYIFEVVPERTGHSFDFYDYQYVGRHDPAVLYDGDGQLLHYFLTSLSDHIEDTNKMKYSFTEAGTYQISLSSYSSDDDYFTLKISEGIQPPVSSIPLGDDDRAYIQEGLLNLSTDEVGGRIFYTLDGTDPETSEGGSTIEFISGTIRRSAGRMRTES